MLHDNTIVILCQDDAIIKWHYYLSKYGHFKSYIITANCKLKYLQHIEYNLKMYFSSV